MDKSVANNKHCCGKSVCYLLYPVAPPKASTHRALKISAGAKFAARFCCCWFGCRLCKSSKVRVIRSHSISSQRPVDCRPERACAPSLVPSPRGRNVSSHTQYPDTPWKRREREHLLLPSTPSEVQVAPERCAKILIQRRRRGSTQRADLPNGC